MGKTTIAANLGVALSKLGHRVTLLDLDIAMPNLEVITGLKSTPVGIKDVLEGTIDLERASYRVHGNLKVIPPGVMLEGYTEENKEKIRKLLEDPGLDTDYVILDMPPGREAVGVLSGGYGSMLVVNPDRASVLDAINMKAVLEDRGVELLGAILNKSGKDEGWIDKIENALEVEVVGVLPESKVVSEAFENEECFVETEPREELSQEIVELAQELDRHW